MTGWWSFSRSDDSPQLQAGGFLNDIAVSSHGNSSVQPARASCRSKTTHASVGTTNVGTFVLLPWRTV
ncbi:MAG TPA: hypothetical protein VNW73_04940 [Ktedonobacteraceae bacterium]|nr:hypothetical protein [Ktedonobacteraceae bacterium]